MENEIILTKQQLAKKKYYEKMKSDPKYIEKRKMHCKKYYQKVKDDPDFKERNLQNQKIYNPTLNDLILNISL